jgi:hypothetical protein
MLSLKRQTTRGTPQKVLTSSRKVDDCIQPLVCGGVPKSADRPTGKPHPYSGYAGVVHVRAASVVDVLSGGASCLVCAPDNP